jgi:hypothetical protein
MSSASHRDYIVTLLDLNTTSLRVAQRAITAAAPNCRTQLFAADIRAEIPERLRQTRFDSISMLNLFHCVPGGLSKFHALKTYTELLNPGRVLVGCTILGQHNSMNWLARSIRNFYNWTGMFYNLADTEEALVNFPRHEFDDVETRRIGVVVIFKITRP